MDESDNCGGMVTMAQSPVSGSSQTGVMDGGTFAITVTATDNASPANATTCTVTVTVNDDDVPVISLIGNSTVHICAGDTYTDAGATATDNCDGNLTSQINMDDSNVNTNVPGIYTVTFDVDDAAGNAATQVIRMVEVHALPAPVCPAGFNACRTGGTVSLSGATPAGGAYSGTGVTGNIFDPMVAGVGVHPITYSYTDGNGCTGTCTFNITVFEAPIYNVNDNKYYCSITDAVAAALTNDGDVIEIPAGTYTEPCILVNKSVMIRPVGGTVTIQCLIMNGSGKIAVMDGDLIINQLTLTNGLIRTNGHNLKCGTITGGGPGSYVVTD